MTESEVKDTAKKPAASGPYDWDQRRLCGDESCIGVIGPDGRCKECGRPPEEAAAGLVLQRPEPHDVVVVSDGPSQETGPADVDEEWENRRLCGDESCIGVIGPDGRCKECGKQFREQPNSSSLGGS